MMENFDKIEMPDGNFVESGLVFNTPKISETENNGITIVFYEKVPEGDVIAITLHPRLLKPLMSTFCDNNYPGFIADSCESIELTLNGDTVACLKVTLSKKELFKEEPQIQKVFFVLLLEPQSE